MKYLCLIGICISTCALAASDHKWKPKFLAFMNQCIEETGVEKLTVQNAFQGNFTDDVKLKAFAFCMCKKGGLLNADGQVQLDVLKKQLPDLVEDPDEAMNLIAKCVGKEGTPEDIAFQTFVCYHKNKTNRE